MKSIHEVGELLAKRYEANRSKWLRAAYFGEAFVFEAPLNVSRKEAAADIVHFRRWLSDWKDLIEADDEGLELRYKAVVWRELGLSNVPSRIDIKNMTAAFRVMPEGELRKKKFALALNRLRGIETRAGKAAAEAFAGESKAMFDADEAEFERLLSVVLWLRDHPKANCFIRELPIEGVDTKWLENNRAVTARILSILLNESIGAEDLALRWGLKTPPILVRVRHAQSMVEGLPPEAFVALPLSLLESCKAPAICVIENLQTGLALEVDDDIPVICGMGNAVHVLREVKALQNMPIFYMGDLDQHGLRILAMFRSCIDNVTAVLTDCETLARYRHLAVTDPTEPIAIPPEGLTSDETELFEALQKDGLRLEQERIPMSVLNREFVSQIDSLREAF